MQPLNIPNKTQLQNSISDWINPGLESSPRLTPPLQFRKTAIYLSVNQYFDYLVMLTILANCAFLAMTEPINEAE